MHKSVYNALDIEVIGNEKLDVIATSELVDDVDGISVGDDSRYEL